uniref:Unspecific monooxygenase n=1 Tax=Panagrellus redivivus TaxID=6233 RepID=A0A7E4VNV7_PANRE
MGVILLAVVFVLLTVFYNCYWKRRHLPPGPMPLPLIGNAHLVSEKQFLAWTKQYGPVYTYWVSEMPVVAVNDVDVIIDTFVKDGDKYVGRPQFEEAMELFKNGSDGIIFNECEVWRDQRRFALQVLREFGLGKNQMQEQILDEFGNLMTDILEMHENGGSVDIKKSIDVCVGNMINNILFGFHFEKDKQAKFYHIKSLMLEANKPFGSFPGLLFFHRAHCYKNVPYMSKIYKTVAESRDAITEFITESIAARKANIDFEIDSKPLDFTEAFLRAQYKCEKEGVPHFFTDKQMNAVLFDLWFAGQETTSTTLGWAFCYLIKFPHVQKRLQAEIDEVVGSDRLITCDDKTKLHYANAVVAEVQRFASILPQNLLHRTVADVIIAGHKIPKHTVITHQISSVMRDERYFPEPEKFKPERFLKEDGTFFNHPGLMPFGVGKRACLGESMAKMELFLFIVNTVNQFTLFNDPKYPAKLERLPSGTIAPSHYKCLIEHRFKQN